jgi:hypothetical protein
MILWDAALREERLLDHATQERMYKPVQLADGHFENYGLGWGIGHYRQHSYISHAGGLPGFSTFFGRFPVDGITIILLSNRDGFDTYRLARKIGQQLLELPPLVRRPSVLTPEILQQMVGTYNSVHGTVEVSMEKQSLTFHWEQTHDLVPLSEKSFYWAEDEDVEVHFENQNTQGIYERLRVIQPFFWFTAERGKPEA